MADARSDAAVQDKAGQDRAARRKIPGGLPYTTSPGVLKGVLEKIPHSEKSHVFNTDCISTVLGSTGGAARQVPPILKTAGLLSQALRLNCILSFKRNQGGLRQQCRFSRMASQKYLEGTNSLTRRMRRP